MTGLPCFGHAKTRQPGPELIVLKSYGFFSAVPIVWLTILAVQV